MASKDYILYWRRRCIECILYIFLIYVLLIPETQSDTCPVQLEYNGFDKAAEQYNKSTAGILPWPLTAVTRLSTQRSI